MNKVFASPEQAIADIAEGATIAIAGFSVAHRFATSLILALRDKGTRNLTIVCNSLGDPGATRGQILAENGQVKKLIAAFSVRPGTPTASEEQIASGKMEVELVPQGILVERCRAGGAGIPAFYSPTSVGSLLTKGKEIRNFNGKPHVLEHVVARSCRLKADIVEQDEYERTGLRAVLNYGLTFAHAFEDLGYRRLEWLCNSLNERSRGAAERFGFTFEGIARQHMFAKGKNRDTAWFSITDKEWPGLRDRFERWLDDFRPARFSDDILTRPHRAFRAGNQGNLMVFVVMQAHRAALRVLPKP